MKPLAAPVLGIAAALCAWALAGAQGSEVPKPDLDHAKWPAVWVTCPGVGQRAMGVYHFRRSLRLGGQPARYVVHVSADSRFVLLVNGTRVGDGPARGDLNHWRYETFDLAPYLRAGDNVLAATVWNYGGYAPMAQISDQTGFLVQGDTGSEEDADTGPSWQVKPEPAQEFLPVKFADVPSYYAASPGELLDGPRYDWDWQTSGSGWTSAVPVGPGEPGRYPDATPAGTGSGINPWFLVSDPLPHMEYSDTDWGRVVRVEGMDASASFPLVVPAHTRASLLIDRGTMTTAYPEVGFGGGRGAEFRVTYAEALFDAKGQKGNRDEIVNRKINGLRDRVIADGGRGRIWSPLYWRAWRYLQLEVETGDEPLTLDSLRVHYTGYPFQERARVEANDPEIARMWEIGTRTARMNAHETYMDCAYWEQLQYLGDSRIDALLSYVEFGDDRLARQALDAFDYSRTSEGLTLGRYPAAVTQVISTFSLYWVGMLHDYWLYRPDTRPLSTWVPHTRTVIDWYTGHLRPDGLLGTMPWWNYADWTKDFDFGVPPQDPDGGSCLLSLTFMGALRDAADLEDAFGRANLASEYRKRAETIGRAAWALCWDESRGLLADTPAKRHFSEETNALGVLLDVVPAERRAAVMEAVLTHRQAAPGQRADGEFSPASLYFRFYVARALDHAGMADKYLGTLGPWRAMLGLGLTTWAETAEPTRSDDHAWSAHPNYDLLTLVAGIRPGSPGFRTVLVEPHPGDLTEVRASMPHPEGAVSVHGRKDAKGWLFEVVLPQGVPGTFRWAGADRALSPGPNTVDLRR
jgi:hypothetical protein